MNVHLFHDQQNCIYHAPKMLQILKFEDKSGGVGIAPAAHRCFHNSLGKIFPASVMDFCMLVSERRALAGRESFRRGKVPHGNETGWSRGQKALHSCSSQAPNCTAHEGPSSGQNIFRCRLSSGTEPVIKFCVTTAT